MNRLDPPLREMIQNLMASGGTILVCPPCAKVRSYSQDDLLEGVIIAGSSSMHELIKQGAATLSFC